MHRTRDRNFKLGTGILSGTVSMVHTDTEQIDWVQTDRLSHMFLFANPKRRTKIVCPPVSPNPPRSRQVAEQKVQKYFAGREKNASSRFILAWYQYG